jgi:site-specific DNA-methyltransferase (adenine-specific)
MRTLPDNSVDSIVTDPPAGIAFMGKAWDTDKGGRKQWCAYMEERFAEALRVCKPGAHALVWALPRTSHWTATALEDAGWEIRDICVHLFGGGFPKSQNIGKAIDKAAGADREVIGIAVYGDGHIQNSTADMGYRDANNLPDKREITAPATPEAQQWDGWGTALKPASEHWILCRKPIKGTIAGNVLEWGVGGIHIDACRVEFTQNEDTSGVQKHYVNMGYGGSKSPEPTDTYNTQGRFPPNLLLSHAPTCDGSGCADACPIRLLDEQTGVLKVGGDLKGGRAKTGLYMTGSQMEQISAVLRRDEGGASRYFPNFGYYPKASKRDRTCNGKAENNHPTVKNRDLMRWLCRLITPPGGTVLDCFAGSGSTAIACLEEGFNYVLIEQDEESVGTARKRIASMLPVAIEPLDCPQLSLLDVAV